MKSTEFLAQSVDTLTRAVHIVLHDCRPSLSQGMTKLGLWLMIGSSAIVFLNTPQWHSSSTLKQNDTSHCHPLSESYEEKGGTRIQKQEVLIPFH